MTRIIQAELFRLARRRTMAMAAAGAALFSAVATLAVFSSATASDAPTMRTRTSRTSAIRGGAHSSRKG